MGTEPTSSRPPPDSTRNELSVSLPALTANTRCRLSESSTPPEESRISKAKGGVELSPMPPVAARDVSVSVPSAARVNTTTSLPVTALVCVYTEPGRAAEADAAPSKPNATTATKVKS